MALQKKLATGTKLRTYNYDDPTYVGQTVSVENDNGDYTSIIHIESAVCNEGVVDRVVIKKSVLKELGFVIIEE